MERTRITRWATALTGSVALVLGGVSAAQADDPTPSAAQVKKARDAVTSKQGQVAAIRAKIDAANARVSQLEVAAAAAAERYNGAQVALTEAKAAAARVKAQADAADKAAEEQRLVVERLTVEGVTARAPYNRVRSLFTHDGPASLLGQISTYDAVGDATRAALATYESRKAVATSLGKKRDAAVAKQARATRAAAQAKDAAGAAVASAAAAQGTLESERQTLVRQLADAEGISVRLARSRQRALEELAEKAQEASNRARSGAALPAANTAPPAAPAPESDRPASGGSGQSGSSGSGSGAGGGASSGGSGSSGSSGGGTSSGGGSGSGAGGGTSSGGGSSKPPASNPKPAKGVEAAVRFALAQVGEPYVWGAAGPGSWDCSGLTMMAWAAAGKSLPHFSGAQYAASTPISLANARRGDLLFWSNGGPGSIYHVALYLGNGWMVQAPRPARGVEVVSVYSWTAPDLAARVR